MAKFFNIRRLFQWRNKTKLASPESNLPLPKIKTTKRRTLAFSPKIKQFVKQHRGVLIPCFQMIQQHLKELREGIPIANKETGVKIERAATGGYCGNVKIVTVKVQASGKEFFVTVDDNPDGAKQVLKNLEIAESRLETIEHRIGKYSVQLIKPHLVYAHSIAPGTTNQTVFWVTNFYSPKEVMQVWETRGKLRQSLYAALTQLKMQGTLLPSVTNTFYNRKTREILIYDIEDYPFPFIREK
ncbi:MAG: hypothetical protein PHD95_02560 [Candidatus ainarchaeum sp.]|nr:hypothetical protein [Candidatus ainarchaeum sp.]